MGLDAEYAAEAMLASNDGTGPVAQRRRVPRRHLVVLG